MSEIRVEPQNPGDFRPGDIEDLVQELRAALPNYGVRPLPKDAMPAGMRGVTWWEIVHVYLPLLPDIGDDVRAILVAKALEASYQWAKRRFKRKREGISSRRPQCVIVHSEDGAAAGSMVLHSSRHKPISIEEHRAREARASKPKLPRPRRRRKKRPK
jgi:hypothetical protein